VASGPKVGRRAILDIANERKAKLLSGGGD
jgi:hypothetical protein